MAQRITDEKHYETTHRLYKDIHYRDGQIMNLEHINAKHCREIERLVAEATERSGESFGSNLAWYAKCEKKNRQIERLTKELAQVKRPVTENDGANLFWYIKFAILELSKAADGTTIDPDEIDIKYIEAAIRYTLPGLFSEHALLSENDKKKIALATAILDKLGIETMSKYDELAGRGDVTITINYP